MWMLDIETAQQVDLGEREVQICESHNKTQSQAYFRA